MEKKWFETSIKYNRNIDGNEKSVNEKYLVGANDISEVKNKIFDTLSPFFEGDSEVTSIQEKVYNDILLSESIGVLNFYTTTYKVVVIDEKTGKDKYVTERILVEGSDFEEGYVMSLVYLNKTLKSFFITSVELTKIIDVIE